MCMRKLSIILLLFSSFAAVAQSDRQGGQLSFFERLDSIQTFKIEHGKTSFTPFIAPSYSPELKGVITAGGLLTFTLDKDRPLVKRSSIPFSVGVSTNGSIIANIRANVYGKDDLWVLRYTFWLKNMPDHYFGVGYYNGRYTPKGDSTSYHRNWQNSEATFLFKILGKFYLGLNYNSYVTKATEVNERMAKDPDYLAGGSEVKGRGLGLSFTFDTRDFPENAYKGFYINLNNTAYSPKLGSDFLYEVINIDYRQYMQIGRPRSTLAWQFRGRITLDFIPWPEKSQLGTPFDLRGYLWGQYRDDEMIYGILEYRRMFMRKTKNKKGNYNSPFGLVGWVAAGSISPKDQLATYWLPNVGVGFRFEVQKRMNLRLDYGFGQNTSAFYFSFNEAF